MSKVLRAGSLVLLVLAVFGLAACSSDKKKDSGALTVKDAWVRATASEPMAGMESAGQTTGAFMVIDNTTGTAERLIRVEVSPDLVTTVEIHETTIDSNQVMQMRPVDGIDIPAHGSVELKAGSYHVMLIGVKQALNAGDKVPLTLVFESGKQISVEAEVRPLG